MKIIKNILIEILSLVALIIMTPYLLSLNKSYSSYKDYYENF